MTEDGMKANPDENTQVPRVENTRRTSERNKDKGNDKTIVSSQADVNSTDEDSDSDESTVNGDTNEDPCGVCNKSVTPVDKALFCEICSFWFHILCIRVPTKKYNFLKQNEDIHWYCNQCNRAAKSLHQDMVTLKAENALLKESLQQIEERFITLEEERRSDRIDWMIAVDKNEQYSRKDALRFSGIPHSAGETNEQLEDKIIEIANKAGVQLKRDEISVTHRLRPDRKGGVPTIIKFTSRRAKDKVFFAKKNLKTVEDCKDVFITEDLTRLRFRTLLMAKRCPQFKSVSTKGGKIFIWREDTRDPVTIESPRDLLKLGVDPDWKFLGLVNE